VGTENLERDLVFILLVFGLVFSITLDYAVTVTNTGQAADIYNLWTSASAGWFPHIEPSSLTLDPGESDST